MSNFEDLFLEDQEFVLNLPYLLAKAGMMDDLCEILTDFYFIEHNLNKNNAFGLLDSYNQSLKIIPSDSSLPKHNLLPDIAKAYSQEVQELERFEQQRAGITLDKFIFQQLRNRAFRNSKGKIDLCDYFEVNLNHILLHHRPLYPTHFNHIIRTRQDKIKRRYPGGTIQFTPDGQQLIAATTDSKAPLINPENGQILLYYQCVSQAVTFDFSDDGSKIVFGGKIQEEKAQGFIQVFDQKTGQELNTKILDIWISKIFVTRDKKIIALCADGKIKVFDLDNLQLIKNWNPDIFCVSIDYHKNLNIIATGEYHNENKSALIKIWNTVNFKLLKEINGPKYGITSLAFSEDGHILCSGSADLSNGFVAWAWQMPQESLKVDQEILNSELLTNHSLDKSYRDKLSKEGSIICKMRTNDSIVDMSFLSNSFYEIVAVEGTHLEKSNAINIFNIFRPETTDVFLLMGNQSPPIAVDTDSQGNWMATLHSGGEIIIWSINTLKRISEKGNLQCSNQPLSDNDTKKWSILSLDGTSQSFSKEKKSLENSRIQLTKHSVDEKMRYILSVSLDGAVYITDTDQQITTELTSVSHSAKIAPSGDFFIRTYWDQLPINYYNLEYPNNEEIEQIWWKQFIENTNVCCFIYPLAEESKSATSLSWSISPNLSTLAMEISPDGRWGAILFKQEQPNKTKEDEKILLHILFESGKANLRYLPDSKDFVIGDIKFTSDSKNLLINYKNFNCFWVCECEAFFESKTHPLSPKTYFYLELPQKSHYTPLLINNNLFIIAYQDGEVYLVEDDENQQNVISLRKKQCYHHNCPIIGIFVSKDGQKLIISDAHPAITVLRLPTFEKYLWLPLEQLCPYVFIDKDCKKLLAIGVNSEVMGPSYSLMMLADECDVSNSII